MSRTVAASEVTPVTVLTGVLGSGTSTLVNRMLRDPRYGDTAVVVNEWGEAAIDHALVRESNENIVTLSGGCICCRVAGDLVGRLRELHFQRAAGIVPPFRRVLIEMPVVAARYALAGVVATVDAEHGERTLDAHPEAVRQVAMADRLVLTKVDRAQDHHVRRIESRLAALNPAAPILHSRQGDADPARLFDAGLHRPGGPSDASGWLNAGAYRSFAPRGNHDARIASFVWTLDDPLDAEDFGAALETVVELLGERILRMKGLVHVRGREGPMAVHGVRHTLYPPAWLDRWPDADRRTRLVFIGLDLEETRVAQILNSFLASKPRHGLQR